MFKIEHASNNHFKFWVSLTMLFLGCLLAQHIVCHQGDALLLKVKFVSFCSFNGFLTFADWGYTSKWEVPIIDLISIQPMRGTYLYPPETNI
jgi:hypothetical protein